MHVANHCRNPRLGRRHYIDGDNDVKASHRFVSGICATGVQAKLEPDGKANWKEAHRLSPDML